MKKKEANVLTNKIKLVINFDYNMTSFIQIYLITKTDFDFIYATHV